MERIWLKSYPPACLRRSIRRNTRAWSTCSSVREFAARPAFHSMGKTITYAELDRLARLRRLAPGAGPRQGLARGDHAAELPAVPVAMFGTLRAGCTVVNVNPLYTARELEHQLRDSGAEAIVILENRGRAAAGARETRSSTWW